MPLINFRTNLTTLRYGLDQPGGGYSGQPYMQFPIDNDQAPPDIRRYYEANRTGLDFPIRGGAISQLVQGEFGAITSTVDRERIQKFFKDAPRGTAFILKQTGLQLTNPRTQVPNSLTFAGPSLGNAVLPVTNVYNPLNTLAQVQVQGTGAHFNRHGVFPTIYEPLQQTYQYIAGNPQNNTEVTNRLTILKALKLLRNTNFLVNSSTLTGVGIDPLLVDRLGISTIQNQLFNYQGGPGSVYGIGFTRIFRATDTEARENPVTGIAYSNTALTYQQLAEQSRDRGFGNAYPTLQDFRNQLPTGTTARSDYKTKNIQTRLNVGNPGAVNSRIQYNQQNATGVDRLNALNPFYFNPTQTDPWTAGGSATNDMIRFGFECIDNNNVEDSVALMFRAFLDGSISDTNTGEYNSFKYLGRGETFRTYQGFERTIGFGFKVFTQSRSEMMPLYKKVNQLISQVYPDYSPEYNLMRGNVVRLTIGDYIYRMPGFLESVNVTIDNSNTPWEILLGEYVEDDVRQLPHMITIQCSFKPIMDILPRKQSYVNPFVPLIANRDNYLNPNATTVADQQKLTLTAEESEFNPDGTVRFRRTAPTTPPAPTVFTGRPIDFTNLNSDGLVNFNTTTPTTPPVPTVLTGRPVNFPNSSDGFSNGLVNFRTTAPATPLIPAVLTGRPFNFNQ